MLLADAAHFFRGFIKGRLPNRGDVYRFLPAFRKKYYDREGGAICIEFTAAFRQSERTAYLRALALNGQNKKVLSKNQVGAWRYDIIDQGTESEYAGFVCATVGFGPDAPVNPRFCPKGKPFLNFMSGSFQNGIGLLFPPIITGIRRVLIICFCSGSRISMRRNGMP